MNVTATVVDSQTIIVTWEPSQANVQNGIIQNYTVAVLEQQTSSSFTLVSTVAAITVSDLHPSYDYTVQVAAVTVGTGPFSDMVTTTTLEDGKWSAMNKHKWFIVFVMFTCSSHWTTS